MIDVRRYVDCLLLALPAAGCLWIPAVHAEGDLPPAREQALHLIAAHALGELPPRSRRRLPEAVGRALRGKVLRLKPARELVLARLPPSAAGAGSATADAWITAGLAPNPPDTATQAVLLAQAPGQKLSALGELAPAAGPRWGEGESALTGTAPAGGARLNRNRAAATAVAAAESAPQGDGKDKPETQKGRSFLGLKLWGVPPIRWGGDISLDLRSQFQQGQPRRISAYENLGLRASSYIWQPWFAQVNGLLRMFKSQDGLGAKGGDAGTGGAKSTSLGGTGTLTLFPVSRFPFSASYDVADSRANSELITSNYTSKRLALRQSYSPLQGNSNYSLAYDRSAIESTSFAGDVAQSLTLAASEQSGAHSLSFNGNRYRDTPSGGDSSNLARYVINHSYRPNSTLSVESFANYSTNDYRLNSNSASPWQNRSSFVQLNSFANWRPSETSPLSVTGGGRLFTTRTENNGIESSSNSLAANAAASYQYNRNVMLNAGANINQVESGGNHTLATNLNGGANYTSDIVSWGAYRYGWNGGANLSTYNQGGGAGAAGAGSKRSTFNTRIGHNINRQFTLGDNSSIGIFASQAYARVADSVYPTSQTLVHNGGLNWSRRAGEAASGMLGLTASDSRTTGLLKQHFEMVNLQASGQFRTSQHGFLNANFTVQGTRQSSSSASSPFTGLAAPTGFNTNTSGSVGFQHMRAFGVAGLRSLTSYNVNQYQYRTRFDGDINAPIERVNHALEQRFDYSIGRIDLRLSLRIAELEGRTNGLLFFTLTRQFGAY